MNHEQLQDFLGFVNQEQCRGNRISPIVWGSTGVGKTQAIEAFARSIRAECIVLHLASQDPGDLIGLPTRDEENGTTKWLRPEWMPSEDDDRPFVIFLDEFNRANRYVLDVMLPFLLDGTLGTHRVPSNTLIVAAGNPGGTEDYSVTEIEDKAMLSRLCHIGLAPSFPDWKDFVEKEVHPSIIQAISSNTAPIFKTVELPEVEADPRSLHIAGKALNAMSESQYSSFGYQFLFGMVGPVAGAICQHYEERAKKKIAARRIVTEYDIIRPAVLEQIEDVELCQAAVNETVDILRDLLENRTDEEMENDSTLRNVFSNVSSFALDLPGDLFMAMISQLNAGSNTDIKISLGLTKNGEVVKRYDGIRSRGQGPKK